MAVVGNFEVRTPIVDVWNLENEKLASDMDVPMQPPTNIPISFIIGAIWKLATLKKDWKE